MRETLETAFVVLAFIFGVGAIVMLNVAVYYFAWKVFQAVIR